MLNGMSLQADFSWKSELGNIPTHFSEFDQSIANCAYYGVKSCDHSLLINFCEFNLHLKNKNKKPVFICEDFHKLVFTTEFIFIGVLQRDLG